MTKARASATPGGGEIEPTTYRTHIWSSNTPNWGLKM
jgi:hypothetical protein